jgi:hypothetical protein
MSLIIVMLNLIQLCLVCKKLSPQSGREERQGLLSVSKRILIVDDDPDITFTFKKGLEAEN